ncbi:MAG: hypothetical protein H6631_17220 [Anaerolineaceae bacterium]|nr:hypothetical protein [Anaerolineaceae bacterium]
MTSKGVIYIATGKTYIDEVTTSVASLKTKMPHIPITLFTDQGKNSPHFDQVIKIDPTSGFEVKVQYMSQSPYDYTLFLDSDTYICDDVSDLFTLLDRFDIAAAHAPFRAVCTVDGVPETFPELNTGVLLYKKTSQLESMLSEWLNLYKQYQDSKYPDQPAFRQALYESNLRIAILTPEYNCRFIFPGYAHGAVKLLHGRHLKLPRVASTLNETMEPRIHYIHQSEALKTITHSRNKTVDKFSFYYIKLILQTNSLRGIITTLIRKLNLRALRFFKARHQDHAGSVK